MKLINIQNKGIFVILTLLLVVAVSGCTTVPQSTNPTSTNPQSTNTAVTNTANTATTTGQNQAGPKITDAKYANVAYLISGDTLDAATQTAISGFNINKVTNSDGTTTFTLTSTNTEYKDQSYTLKPGQKLYFIEKNLGDDSDNNERFLADDTAVVTDADGNII